MANWVKGKLKIRGKPEDIKRWVEECLHCYFTKWFRDGSYEDELVDDAVVFEHDPKAREMRLDTIEDAYIEGTKRNFVEKGVYGDSYREDEKPILVVSIRGCQTRKPCCTRPSARQTGSCRGIEPFWIVERW